MYGWKEYQKSTLVQSISTQSNVSNTVPNTPTISAFTTSTSSTTDGITYVTKTYAPKDAEIYYDYIEITSGLPKPTLDAVNTVLRNPIDKESCYGNPDLPESKSQLLDLYDSIPNETLSTRIPTATLEKMSYKEIQDLLVKEVGYDDNSGQKVLYLDKNVMSVQISTSGFCGGPYPEAFKHAINLDLTTGKEITYPDLFLNYERDTKKIADIVFPYLQKVAGDPAKKGEDGYECNFERGYRSGGLGPNINAGLSKDGIVVLSLGFPHVLAGCEPDVTVIPFSLLKPYLNMNTPYMKALVK